MSVRSFVNLREKSFSAPEVENPFVLEQKLTALDKLQVALMSVTVAPLRLLLMSLLLVILWFLAVVGVACRSGDSASRPFSGCRKCLRKPFIVLSRVLFFVLGFHYVSTKGKRVSSGVAPLLVAAPHSSMFDMLLLCVGSHPASPVSRMENAEIPVFGSLLKFLEPVLVKREDPQSRMKAVREILDRSSSDRWPQIIIFPEGTCTNRSCLISFKLGAFFPGVPVQPVCVTYPNKLDTVTWTWEGPGVYKQLWLTLCQFYTRCEIEYLPVYVPTELEQAEPRSFADGVRAKMALHLKLPVTDHSFDDCRLMHEAKKLSMSPTAGLVEFEKLHSKLGLSFMGMQELLEQFNKIKGNKSTKEKAACITYEDFKNYLMLPESETLWEVFALYDRDGSGTIDFREYVIGLSLLSSPVNNDDTLDLAFELFDLDGDGFISLEELVTILGRAFNISEYDAKILFAEVNTSRDGKITLDEFKSYAKRKPEYARIFTTYRELKLHEQWQQEMMRDKSVAFYDTDFEQWGIQDFRQ
ncbi:hypothetical protein BsWGS_22764 [Bradybaena similaris]